MITAVAQRQPTLPEQIEAAAPQLARLGVDGQRFSRVLLTEARRNPDLLKCEPTSVLGAALLAAQLRLDPGSTEGHVWLIPRKNKHNGNRLECQFMLGYRGEIVLAERAGWRVNAKLIHANDEFRYVEQPEPEIWHEPNWADPGPLIGAYAVAHPLDGGVKKIAVLNLDEIEERRKASDAGRKNVGPWKSHYPQMARKSAIRALWPQIPASSLDMDVAHRADETVVHPEHIETMRGDAAETPALAGEVTDVQDVTGEDDAEATTETEAADPPPQAERPATDAQIKAIHTLAGKVGIIAGDDDGAYREELHARYEVASAKDLTVQQAGHFIDWLQEQLEAGEGTS